MPQLTDFGGGRDIEYPAFGTRPAWIRFSRPPTDVGPAAVRTRRPCGRCGDECRAGGVTAQVGVVVALVGTQFRRASTSWASPSDSGSPSSILTCRSQSEFGPVNGLWLTELLAHRDHSSRPLGRRGSRGAAWPRPGLGSTGRTGGRPSPARTEHRPPLSPCAARGRHMIAAKASRSPARRQPPPCGRITTVGDTTRPYKSHNSSGTNRSRGPVMHRSTSDTP